MLKPNDKLQLVNSAIYWERSQPPETHHSNDADTLGIGRNAATRQWIPVHLPIPMTAATLTDARSRAPPACRRARMDDKPGR